jgi:leucyl aminopeptidase
MTPEKLAEAALKEKAPKLKTKILDQKEIKKLGMGGIIGVSRGSGERPRFIIMEYRGGKKDEKPVVFVGKGITFDSGGLNLKPGSGICEMHMDMSGGAAVIHALAAIAKIGLKINIIGLVPAVENMPSGSSYRPGDILKTITGKTIEALNTDAEGRIILADALGYAQKYKPKIIADVATLTGAAIVALGQRVNAVFATSPELEKLSREVGEKSGDEAWPLPLWDDYAEEIKSDFADIANVGKNRYGGAIIGAIFLKQFIGDFPWVHLDIAPTMTPIENQYLGKGATGAGTRFLVELAKRYQTKN